MLKIHDLNSIGPKNVYIIEIIVFSAIYDGTKSDQ